MILTFKWLFDAERIDQDVDIYFFIKKCFFFKFFDQRIKNADALYLKRTKLKFYNIKRSHSESNKTLIMELKCCNIG